MAVFFDKNAGPIQEYELITYLQKEGLLDLCADESYWVALFRKHFLVRHCLYRLNSSGLLRDKALLIGPLTIELSAADICSDALPSADITYQALASYYGDLSHWLNASEANCRSFIDDFWQRFMAANNLAKNLLCLGLPTTAAWPEVQARYRRLAQQHHPDKGGDAEEFLCIQQAYDELKRLWGY